ncbi:DUF2767 family protein [Rahnella sp. ChDrAdgB13]|uniref:DUF2767 family protein n=1 Tax=Rahnella sp. ChDrAdgB13 TaxID=1850581 RepID=UPI001FCBB364
MYSKDADAMYDEMCRLIGDVVLTMHDFGIEPKHIVIADMLRTALASDAERPEFMVKAMKLAIKTLET